MITKNAATTPAVSTKTGASRTARSSERPNAQTAIASDATTKATDSSASRTDTRPGYLCRVAEPHYRSGDDFLVEFVGFKFAFDQRDFEERVTASAVRLGLVETSELDDDEIADLVELAADGQIDEPRSALGRYLRRHWERISLLGEESLVYWLRKLVFRGAWLDQAVKDGRLEVSWDDRANDFNYRDPRGDRALLDLAPVPSWREVQFRR